MPEHFPGPKPELIPEDNQLSKFTLRNEDDSGRIAAEALRQQEEELNAIHAEITREVQESHPSNEASHEEPHVPTSSDEVDRAASEALRKQEEELNAIHAEIAAETDDERTVEAAAEYSPIVTANDSPLIHDNKAVEDRSPD